MRGLAPWRSVAGVTTTLKLKAEQFPDLADEVMGPGWATAKTFRFGASGLYGVLADIIAGTAPAERTDGAY